MALPNPLCLLRTLWRSIRTGGLPLVQGCDFVEEGAYENCTVQVLRCEVCGQVSVGWSQGSPAPRTAS